MTDTEAQSVALPPIVDLDALDSIRDQLIDALGNGPVEVDGSAVERVATNALLMLMSADVTARQSEFGFSINQASEPMLAAIERLGLGESFTPLLKGQE